MLDLGLHFGHLKKFSHPKSKPNIFSVSNGVAIIDLKKTESGLKETIDYVKKLAKEGKNILFVGTKRQTADFVREKAESIGMPYISRRFMGGTLSNFDTVLRNIKKLIDLETATIEKSTSKKEESRLNKEKERLQSLVGGMKEVKKLPDALFLVDMNKEKNACIEARNLKIPVVGIADTNTDPSLATCTIPANDDSTEGVKYIVTEIVKAYQEGQGKKKAKKDAKN